MSQIEDPSDYHKDRFWPCTLEFTIEEALFGEHMHSLEPYGLRNLKNYRYQSVDKSYLSYYILNPFWTFCAEFMPSWLAPNTITLIGLLAIYINIACILIWIPDLQSEAPRWLYFSFAFGLLFYQTMDNIDGKQARKTGMSSPLGELFDHGIDSLNCCLAALVDTACMGLGSSRIGAFVTFSTCVAMYLSTWETYHTHVLYLGYMNGPTEGIVIAACVMAATGVWGPQIWQQLLADVLPESVSKLLPTIISQLTLASVWAWVVSFAVFICHVPVCLFNVYRATKRTKKCSYSDCLSQLSPIVFLGLALAIWVASPSSTVLSDNHLVLFTLTVSLVYGRMTTSIILAHLTKQPFPQWSLPQIPLVLGAVLFGALPQQSVINPLPAWFETGYLWAYFVLSFNSFMRFAILVIRTLCKYLNIPCFTVRAPPVRKHA